MPRRAPEDFAVRMAHVKLKDAKTYIRALKAFPAATPEAGSPKRHETEPQVPQQAPEPSSPEQAPEPWSPPAKDPASVSKSASSLPPSGRPPSGKSVAVPKMVHATDERVTS